MTAAGRTGGGLVDRRRSLLLVVDAQEGSLAPEATASAVTARIAALIECARVMDVPVVLTEHSKEMNGPVLSDLVDAAEDARTIPKQSFKATAELAFSAHLMNLSRTQVVVCGFEAQAGMIQTVFGLAEEGYSVFVANDAVAAPADHSRLTALWRMSAAGVQVITAEMAVYEWLETAENRRLPQLAGALERLRSLSAKS